MMDFETLQQQRKQLSVTLRGLEAELAKQLWQSRPSKLSAPGDNDRNIEMHGRCAILQSEVDKLRDQKQIMDDMAAYLIAVARP